MCMKYKWIRNDWVFFVLIHLFIYATDKRCRIRFISFPTCLCTKEMKIPGMNENPGHKLNDFPVEIYAMVWH